MRQSQAEIKAIEAELQSIRADSSSSNTRSVTLLEPGHRWNETTAQPVSPTIVRQPSQQTTQGLVKEQKPAVQPRSKKRTVECFPLPSAYAQTRSVEAQLTTAVQQLHHQSNESIQQFKQVQSQFLKNSSRSKQETARRLLEEKVEEINRLSSQQEIVILELMTISEQLTQEQQGYKTKSKQSVEPICEYLAAEVSYVEKDKSGTLILTTRLIEPVIVEQSTDEATATVEMLRQRTRKQQRGPLIYWLGRKLWRWTWSLISVIGAVGTFVIAPISSVLFGQTIPLHRKTYRAGRRAVAREKPFTLQEAATLMLGSALLRIFLDWVVVSYPMLWIPSILVMLAPALLAVYRSTVMPQTGFVWGYRLFSIMIGLLLGGRV